MTDTLLDIQYLDTRTDTHSNLVYVSVVTTPVGTFSVFLPLFSTSPSLPDIDLFEVERGQTVASTT